MKTIPEKIEDIENRLSIIEQMLGIPTIEPIIDPEKVIVREPLIIKESESKPKKEKIEPKPEDNINGFTKDQLRVMYSWAERLKLKQITKSDFNELKNWGMLYDFYPDAPEFYEEIKR